MNADVRYGGFILSRRKFILQKKYLWMIFTELGYPVGIGASEYTTLEQAKKAVDRINAALGDL